MAAAASGGAGGGRGPGGSEALPVAASFDGGGGERVEVIMVTTPAAAAAAAARLADDGARGALAVDLEGVALGRPGGTISIVQVVAAVRPATVYLFDVTVLGERAFGPAGAPAPTLRTLLQEPAVTKLLWDCRADAHALFRLYDIRMAGVVDLQVSELLHRVARRDPPTQVSSLAWLIERTSLLPLPAAQRRVLAELKRRAGGLFLPRLGGSYAVWDKRPLNPVLMEYATDARLFFLLRSVFAASRVEEEPALRDLLARCVTTRLDAAHSMSFVVDDHAAAVRVDAAVTAFLASAAYTSGGGGGAGRRW